MQNNSKGNKLVKTSRKYFELQYSYFFNPLTNER